MTSVLTKMLARQLPAEILYEDERLAAVLEPAPLAEGHAIVFPKREIESWLDLGPRDLEALVSTAQTIARAVQKAVGCPRVALLAYGLKTPHVHFHLVPVRGAAGEIDLTRARPAAEPQALQTAAARIRAEIQGRKGVL